MAKRSKGCSDNEISVLINSDLDSSDSETMDYSLNHQQEALNCQLPNAAKRVSLRIKLRRSTDQSVFKITRNSPDYIDLDEYSFKPTKRSKRLQQKSLEEQKHVKKNNQDKDIKNNTIDNTALAEVLSNVQLVDTMEKDIRTSSRKSRKSKDQLGTCSIPMTVGSSVIEVNDGNNKNKENKPVIKVEEDTHSLEVIDRIHETITNNIFKKENSNQSTSKICKNKGTPNKFHQSNEIKHASMKKRNVTIKTPTTPLQEARRRLHVCFVPKSLPCREQEFNDIFSFLERKLIDKSGGCIYISGVPGTGKTATVNEVIQCLKKSVAKGELDDFNYVEINSMKLSEPRQVYVQILKQLSGETLAWEPAYHALEKIFDCKGKRNGKFSPMTLLLVDELDLLCTKRQDVVYNILDWPTKLSARLVVITIANTMDLPERLLMSRVTSRLGLTRLTFQPYNYKQLQEIVSTRLKSGSADSFRSEAIQLVARKVSAVSGDARRALDICRRATEIAESRGTQVVVMQDVNQALSEMIATAKVQAIKHCSPIEQIFLQAVCAEIARTGIEETCFKNVHNQFASLCSFDGVKIPTLTETLAICARLGSSRLLICEHSRRDIYQKILLNVSSDDIHYALKKMDSD